MKTIDTETRDVKKEVDKIIFSKGWCRWNTVGFRHEFIHPDCDGCFAGTDEEFLIWHNENVTYRKDQ